MKQKILIIGTGFSGMWSALSAARLIEKQNHMDVEITVLAPEAELRVRPRFYETEVHQMKAPLGALFNAVGVKFIKGKADKIHSEHRNVEYTNAQGEKQSFTYDRLILASGSRVVRPKLAGVVEHAFDVDQLDEAVRLENHIKALDKFSPSEARNTVVVAGGGFTGIETAAEMPARLRAALGNDEEIRVIIIDRGHTIGSKLGEEISSVISDASKDLGVEWCLNAEVVSVDADGVMLKDGERIESKTVVWTVGVRASSLTEQISGERDGFGRMHVDQNLKVIGQDYIYATGDVAYAATDNEGNHALMTCQHAISLGRFAGHNAIADLLNLAPIPYSQPKYVTCLDLGAWGAVYSEGWDRQVKMVKDEAKQLKKEINSVWIYPPAANKEQALAAADPLIPVVA